MIDHVRLVRRDAWLAISAVVLVAAVSAPLDAQNRRIDPAGTYLFEMGGLPCGFVLDGVKCGVLSLYHNTTARAPAEPQVPSGSMHQAGIFVGANECVSVPHVVSPGHGVWRADGARGRSVQAVTLHAVTDPATSAHGVVFNKISWSLKLDTSRDFTGAVRIEVYDSVPRSRAGIPKCKTGSIEISGWATFPSW